MSKTLGALLFFAVLAGCGDDGASFSSVEVDPLNKDGFQFQTPVFDVPAGEEIQDCYFVNMPDLNAGQPYWVDRVRVGANPGTHHTNIFRVKTVLKLGTAEQGNFVHNDECFKSGNWADWPLVANNQKSNAGEGIFDWKLPQGVAYKFSPGERIMVQVHYVNANTQETPYKGKAVLDLYKSTMANPIEMGTLFATQQSIRVCKSGPSPVAYTGGCSFKNSGITIAAANGHFHSRGSKFDIFKWDGTTTTPPVDADKFYESTEWDDPPMSIYDNVSGMQIPQNGGVRWTCEYKWSEPPAGCAAVDARDPQKANDCCYTFGPVVETSEHCNAFIYYYPATERSNVACF